MRHRGAEPGAAAGPCGMTITVRRLGPDDIPRMRAMLSMFARGGGLLRDARIRGGGPDQHRPAGRREHPGRLNRRSMAPAGALTPVINIVGNCRQDTDKRPARNSDRRAAQPYRAAALDYRSLAMSQMSAPVEKFTTRNPVTANAEAMIDELRQLMVEHSIRHVPIVRGTSIVG